VTFTDGGQIKWNMAGDQINNIFMGTLGHQILGKIEFHDTQNGLHGFYEFGNVKKKT